MKDVVLGCLPFLTGLTFWDPIGDWGESSGIDATNLRACVLQKGGCFPDGRLSSLRL